MPITEKRTMNIDWSATEGTPTWTQKTREVGTKADAMRDILDVQLATLEGIHAELRAIRKEAESTRWDWAEILCVGIVAGIITTVVVLMAVPQ